MTTIEQFVGLHSQMNEIVRRVGNGSLNPASVKCALQDIIEAKFNAPDWNPPEWWRTPRQQLARARRLWPNTVLPEPPKEFVPRTRSEVLLLHVPDSFDSLWDKVAAPTGYTKFRWDVVKSSKKNLRLAPNKVVYTVPVWLAFDPEHGRGVRPDSLWGQDNLAASEVLSALIQFPTWCHTWFNSAPAPNLTGYQLKYQGRWSNVPMIGIYDDEYLLALGPCEAGAGYTFKASPSVREC